MRKEIYFEAKEAAVTHCALLMMMNRRKNRLKEDLEKEVLLEEIKSDVIEDMMRRVFIEGASEEDSQWNKQP